MTKTNTKRALLMSALSLLLCVSMLVGTTFAWFTDTAASGLNEIIAGNLDVALVDANGDSIEGNTELFAQPELWEPGAVAYAQLKVVNEGTLDLKYNMSINFEDINSIDGHVLSKVLQYAVIELPANPTRENVLAAAKASPNKGNLVSYTYEDVLYAKGNAANDKPSESALQTLVIFWEPNANNVDNIYNVNNGKTTSDGNPLQINLGVKVVATQVGGDTHEEDSFGNDYDLNAPVLVEVGGVKYQSFADAIKAAETATNATVTLLSDVIIGIPADQGFSEAIVYEGANNLKSVGNGNNIYMIGETQYCSGNDWQKPGIIARNAAVTIENAKIVNDKYCGGRHDGSKACSDRMTVYSYVTGTNVTYNNVDFVGGVVTYDPTSFTDCTFNVSCFKHYALFCDNQYGGNTIDITMTGCEVTARGSYGCIKIADDKSQGGTFTATDCIFNNESGKAADINTNGTVVVTVENAAYYSVETADDLRAVANAATGVVYIDMAEDITLGNAAQKNMGAYFPNATNVTIDGNGKTLTLKGQMEGHDYHDEYYAGIIAPNAAVNVKDVTIVDEKLCEDGTAYSADRESVYTFVRGTNVLFENVKFDGGVQVKNDTKFVGCSFKEDVLVADADGYAKNGRFCVFIDFQYSTDGVCDITFENCDFDASGYGCVKAAGNKGANITVNVKDCSFTNTCPSNSWSTTTPKYDVKMTGDNVVVNDLGGNTWAKSYGKG